jgi:hypothetical protein
MSRIFVFMLAYGVGLFLFIRFGSKIAEENIKIPEMISFLPIDFSPAEGVSTATVDPSSSNDGWLFVGTHNGVATYVKDMKGTKLMAFRGIAVLDLHISQAMGPFANVTKSLEWISLLKSVTKYPILHGDNNGFIGSDKIESKVDSNDLIYQVQLQLL